MAISLRCQGNKPLEIPIKIWAQSNSRIKSYAPLKPVLSCGPSSFSTRRCGCRVAILVRRQRKQPPKTHVKIWARSNGRIKSYGPLEPVLYSGPTRHHRCNMAISLRRKGNKPLETPGNIWPRSNGRIKSYVPLEPKLFSGPWSCPTRRWGCRVAILVRRQGKQPP
jgi:hypothetical protein